MYRATVFCQFSSGRKSFDDRKRPTKTYGNIARVTAVLNEPRSVGCRKAKRHSNNDELSEAIQGGGNRTRFVRHVINLGTTTATTGQGLIFPKYTYLVIMIAAVTTKLRRHHPPPSVLEKWEMCYSISLNDRSSRKKTTLVYVNIKWKKIKLWLRVFTLSADSTEQNHI